LTKLKSLIDAGHENKIAQFVDQLDSEVVLAEELQVKLNGLGETPISEPKIYEAINTGDKITIALKQLDRG